MTIPDPFPPRMSRTPATAGPPVAAPVPLAGGAANAPAATSAGGRPWQRAALLLSIAAQLITISALVSADPIPATWAALLLAIAPAPLAAAAFAPRPAARLAAPLAVAVLVIGIAAQVTHTGLFFVPALVAMAVAGASLWREKARP